MPKFEVKQTYCGQHERYGDFFREWEIKTDCTKEETLEYFFPEILKYRLPCSSEWHKNITYGGEKWGDANYYFSGYYDLQTIDGGFKFVICEPYDD